jgi:hypothetical protein
MSRVCQLGKQDNTNKESTGCHHVSLDSASQADQRSKRSACNQYITNPLKCPTHQIVQARSAAPADVGSGGTGFITPTIDERKSANTHEDTN